ncbi:hypothetical protein APHAL10511_003171 [Amanita phalloides]|nr:hypothetical protein APHAL10511_003171 [Amanita phalloides]
MLMFTEPEVIQLKKLSNSKLELEGLKAHYSYIAAGNISVYNPVSVMSALQQSRKFLDHSRQRPSIKQKATGQLPRRCQGSSGWQGD